VVWHCLIAVVQAEKHQILVYPDNPGIHARPIHLKEANSRAYCDLDDHRPPRKSQSIDRTAHERGSKDAIDSRCLGESTPIDLPDTSYPFEFVE
jgi:hypothetical protein